MWGRAPDECKWMIMHNLHYIKGVNIWHASSFSSPRKKRTVATDWKSQQCILIQCLSSSLVLIIGQTADELHWASYITLMSGWKTPQEEVSEDSDGHIRPIFITTMTVSQASINWLIQNPIQHINNSLEHVSYFLSHTVSTFQHFSHSPQNQNLLHLLSGLIPNESLIVCLLSKWPSF